MNLLKAKKTIEQQDVNEFKLKKEKYLERKKLQKELQENPNDAVAHSAEAPNPATIAPEVLTGIDTKDAQFLYAEYIGSFSIFGNNHQCRIEHAKRKLRAMQNVMQKKSVILIMATTGIRMCDKKGQAILMAHALRRISQAIYEEDSKMFAFMAREPKGHISIQYCHVFIKKDAQQVREMYDALVGLFKTAQGSKVQQEKSKELAAALEEHLEEQRHLFMEVQRRAEAQQRQSEAQNKLGVVENGTRTKQEADFKAGTDVNSESQAGDPSTQHNHLATDTPSAKLPKETWFKSNFSRSDAIKFLLSEEIGSFIIRCSSTQKGSHVLSVTVPRVLRTSAVAHYLIEARQSGYKLKGADKEWPTLQSLIVHHSLMTDFLPCTLVIPAPPNSGADEDQPRPRWLKVITTAESPELPISSRKI